MKNKTILFRADSSSTMGTGHIMRDLVLAKKYAKKGHRVIFATQNLDGNINDKILDEGFGLEVLKSNSKKELKKLIKKLHVDLVVFDSYEIDYKFERYIKEKTGVEILSFDDTYQKHHCNILLNHNISADKKKYKSLVPKNAKLKCGAKYTLLRDEFYKEKNKIYKPNKKFTFFIAMGGADTANLNIKILKVLKKFDNIRVNIVTTTANKNLDKLKKYCKAKKWVALHINSKKIAKLMKKSDYAIVTPSVVANELYFMNVPFMVIKTAVNNQDDIVEFLKNKQCVVLNNFSKNTLLFELNLIINKIQLINFIKLSNKQNIQVLKMRNYRDIRKWMYSKEKIKVKEHLKYIKLLKNKNDRLYFLVKQHNNNIGVIDFINIDDNEAELGIYASPYLRGKGKILLKIIIDYGFNILKLKVLKANVFKKNNRAINLYKSFGFITIKRKKDLIYMELINE